MSAWRRVIGTSMGTPEGTHPYDSWSSQGDQENGMCGQTRHRSRQGTDWSRYDIRRREDPDMRASDEDRERVAQLLRDSAGDGRLDMDELSERLDRVYASRTFGELSTLTKDLPVV